MTNPSTLTYLLLYHLCVLEWNANFAKRTYLFFYCSSTLCPQIIAVDAREVDLVLPSASCRPRSDSLYLWTLRDMATCVATDMT